MPDNLRPLLEIAHNLRWSWQGDAQDLFRRLDAERWEQCYHNPVAMLGTVDQVRLNEMASDEGFLAHLQRVRDDLQQYIRKPGWWSNAYGRSEQPQVAYFCTEFGLSECLPIYSGGLGVLAGDHLKSASELDIPLIGVGLLYQQGYFRQRLNADGWQLELFPRNDFHNMPVELVRRQTRLPENLIGHIEIEEQRSTVEIDKESAHRALQDLKRARWGGRKVWVDIVEPDLAAERRSKEQPPSIYQMPTI